MLFHYAPEKDVDKLILVNKKREMIVSNIIDGGTKVCIIETFGDTTLSPSFLNLDLLFGGTHAY